MPNVFLLLLILAGVMTSAGPWGMNHGVLFFGAGMLMLVFPPEGRLPKVIPILAGIAAFCLFGAMLPATWFGFPEWRAGLEKLGIETGDRVAIQLRQVIEVSAAFILTLLVGLWAASRRTDGSGLKAGTLGFVIAVAVYALASLLAKEAGIAAGRGGHLGFFPNRNHSACFFAMGSIVGVGSVVQAIRDKRWVSLALASVSLTILLWASFGWSISRAGPILIAVGLVAWVLLLGRRYLSGHSGKLLGLIALAAVGGLWLSEGPLKQRLVDSADRLAVTGLDDPASSPGDDLGNQAATVRPENFDFRIPVWRDSLHLISAAPWTGVGAGQYRYTFPQYRDRTIVHNHADVVHPESDWLWLAAEAGVPAALSMLGLVLFAVWYSIKQLAGARARALRAGCLVGALILAVHGIFDVPGHRVPLVWASAMLYGLSLSGAELLPVRGWQASWRWAGLLPLAAGGWLLMESDPSRPGPGVEAVERARTEALRLYREDQADYQSAIDEGREYQPAPGEDRLEQALKRLDEGIKRAPLDRSLRHLRGMLALQFDDKNEAVDAAFERERALDPYWVEIPLRQATAWKEIDVDRTGELWKEAMRRAAIIDKRDSENPWGQEPVRQRIQRQAKGIEELEARIPEVK